ncbi:zinc ABC transporter substrate-binding protein ZnuA [Candidatus Erwinia haradaeae]|uniref:High-affinity zinc uptake system protein ZnuA n=1 Tax=Candidatus Erwinia haradaeae TaxID=1922217 RepID=A0A451D8D2_9GAMM|nr:zinc ABC transporter substrate-binding protein ZnuA [Candidatus Erwinia haradaeae]VFP82033.1 High-affinity zinc uptake system protein ZnuA [Candidatus Erwinia haradaeae]
MLHKKLRLIIIQGGIIISALSFFPVKADIVASIKPIGFIAAAIAHDIVSIEIILPDGASVHDYSLRPLDIKRIRDAELILWSGPAMEAFMSKVTETISIDKKIEIDLLPDIQSLLLRDSNGSCLSYLDSSMSLREMGLYKDKKKQNHSRHNMHFWMSPEISRKIAIVIYEKLLKLMPIHHKQLDANLQHFKFSMLMTDAYINNQLSELKGKGYFVFHDAYAYFEKYYGLTPEGCFTVNPEIPLGAQRLHKIRRALIKKKVICVFSEPQFRPAIIKAIIRDTPVRAGALDPLGVGISLGKDSYAQFLIQLSDQYVNCLKGD